MLQKNAQNTLDSKKKERRHFEGLKHQTKLALKHH